MLCKSFAHAALAEWDEHNQLLEDTFRSEGVQMDFVFEELGDLLDRAVDEMRGELRNNSKLMADYWADLLRRNSY